MSLDNFRHPVLLGFHEYFFKSNCQVLPMTSQFSLLLLLLFFVVFVVSLVVVAAVVVVLCCVARL